MTHPKVAEAERDDREERREEEEVAMEFVDVYEPLKGGEDEDGKYELDHAEQEEEEEEGEEVEQERLQRTAAARRQRDKRTRFEMDERRPAGATALTETMSSDVTFESVLEDNQSHHKIKPTLSSTTEDLRYQMMERKLERLEKRLEAYESLQRKLAKNRTTYLDDGDHDSGGRGGRGGASSSGGGGGADTQQLIEFFLTEMDKQNAVIAQMRANQRVLEQKLEESHRKTHRFHHEQLQRMSQFQEVVHMMNAEFVQGSMLRDEEKALEKNHQDKKTKAVRRALDEQLTDLKNETCHQRRRLEIKFEKKLVDLATENQLLRAENLELRDEVNKLVMAARSTKRTVRVLSDEVIKLKRAVGAAPNPEVEEVLRLTGIHKPTSAGDGPSSYSPSYGGDAR